MPEVDDTYFERCVNIDPLALDDEFSRCPADVAYWNARYADANKAHLLAKVEADRVKGMLYLEHREELQLLERKVTEGLIAAKIDTDPRQIDARTNSVLAEAEKVRLRGICEAVFAKKDMLQSLGAKLREEMKGDPSIRREQQEAKVAKEGY